MRIRGRLVLLLAIPLVGLLGITGYGVAYGAHRSLEANRLQDGDALAIAARELAAELIEERNLLIRGAGADPELRARIDEAGRTIVADAGRVETGDMDPERIERRLRTVERIAELDLGGRVTLRHHSLLVEQLLDLAAAAADPRGAIDDAAASTVDYLARAGAASSEEHALLGFLSEGGEVDASVFQQLIALGAAQESFVRLAASSATDHELSVRIERVGHAMRAADALRRDAFGSFDPERDAEWRAGLVQRTDELGGLQQDAAVLASAAVDDLAGWSRLLLVSAAAAAVFTIVVSAVLLRRALRTIARPLQDLAVQAGDVARHRLPDAVRAQQGHGTEELHLPALRVTGAAEVHEVAGAFNEIQDTALRLAGEQAALRLNQSEAMTNLGRRNQTLLARQLDFISSLETRETDPVFLEHLFKLDHLASRMRRNAESLLILAGSETPRRRRTPAPVTEVVRAAMSEVEEFERVRIGHLRDATVAGPAVIDLVHLLAELIENALGFSPPESTVEIDGRSLGQGGYQFAVIDHGVGMSDLELVAANQRMSGTDELDGMPTRYLGQYVVAKLASKVGAMVHVQPSSGGRGVTAIINLPGSAMLGDPDRSAVAHPLPGSKAARERGPVPFAPGAGVSELARVEPGTEILLDEPLPVDETLPVDTPVPVDAGLGLEEVGEVRFDPPPAPEQVPEQPQWAPEVSHDAAEPFEPATFEPDTFEPDTFEPVVSDSFEPGPDSFEPLTFEPEPDTFEPVMFEPEPVEHEPAEDPLVGAEARTGGLAKRVPGASLAERQANSVIEEAPRTERSATAVQSMLSSFQAGRSRGRDDAATEEQGSDDPVDWRSIT